jgi:hypothetical protein
MHIYEDNQKKTLIYIELVKVIDLTRYPYRFLLFGLLSHWSFVDISLDFD